MAERGADRSIASKIPMLCEIFIADISPRRALIIRAFAGRFHSSPALRGRIKRLQMRVSDISMPAGH